MTDRPAVLFVCVHNAGRSQMAAGFARASGAVDVFSAGSEPADAINPIAVAAMAELGIDIAGEQPAILTPDAVRAADVVITMGCGDACPVFPGKRYEDWELTDPAGQSIEVVRGIRDDIKARVDALLAETVEGGVVSDTKQAIQEHYAAAARESSAGCCAPTAAGTDGSFGAALYDGVDTTGIPESAVVASIACGVPTAMVEFREGDTVLDLGSGGGLDALLSAKRVGPTGRVYGVDMTPEMIELARANADKAGAANVEFLLAEIDAVPLPDRSIDVAISNCVINLAPDKPAVLRELGRLVRDGGRVGISDVVAENHVTVAEREERGRAVGCVAGALSVEEYERDVRDAGFRQVSIEFTHQVAEGMHGAIIRALR